MDDDLYGGDDGTADRRRCTGGERTANREAAKLYNDGYRVGKAHEEERLMQVGFDSGFERGVVVGKLCGELYGACRAAAATAAASAADPSQSLSPSPTAAAMARLLRDNGADASAVNEDGETPAQLIPEEAHGGELYRALTEAAA